MFLSVFEQVNAELRKAAARRASQGLTPGHSAAIAGVAEDEAEGREPEECQADPDMDKAYRDAYPGPGAFADPSALSPGRGPDLPVLQQGHAAPSPGYSLPATFSVPRATLNAQDFRRGPLTGGQASASPSYREGQ